MPEKFRKAIEKCFHRCNLIGEDVNIYKEMNRYKVLREAPAHIKDDIYEDIAYRLGFML